MAISTLRSAIDRLLQQDRVIVAIDGKCTSGKTTLASRLAEIYDCNVFHMDDFFLRP
jgi:uridine kinase